MPELTGASTQSAPAQAPESTPAPVDNPVQANNPAPAEPGATVMPEGTPVEPTTPAEPKVYQPGDPEFLLKILEGANPEELLGNKQPQTAPAEPTNPQEPGQQTPSQQPPATEPQDTPIPDKFKNPDGTLNTQALLQSYTGLEKKLGEQGNSLGQMAQMQQQFLQLQGYIQQMQQPAAQQPQPQVAPKEEPPKFPWEVEMTPEEKAVWQEKFYEDPAAAQAERDQQTIKAMEYRMQQMLNQALTPLTPVIQSHQHQQQVSQYQQQIVEFTRDGQHADFSDLQPEMQQIIQKYGDSLEKLPNPVEAVYQMAKGMKAQTIAAAPPPPTFDEMLKDPNNLQKVLANSEIKNQIVQGYMQEIKKGQPPVTIGAQPGGSPPAAPADKPRSAREASSVFSRFLRQQQ